MCVYMCVGNICVGEGRKCGGYSGVPLSFPPPPPLLFHCQFASAWPLSGCSRECMSVAAACVFVCVFLNGGKSCCYAHV